MVIKVHPTPKTISLLLTSPMGIGLLSGVLMMIILTVIGFILGLRNDIPLVDRSTNDRKNSTGSTMARPVVPEIRAGTIKVLDAVVYQVIFSKPCNNLPIIEIMDDSTAETEYQVTNVTTTGFDLSVQRFSGNPIVWPVSNFFDVVQNKDGKVCLAVSQFVGTSTGGVEYTFADTTGVHFNHDTSFLLRDNDHNDQETAHGTSVCLLRIGAEVGVISGSSVDDDRQVVLYLTNDGLGSTHANFSLSRVQSGELQKSITLNNGSILIISKQWDALYTISTDTNWSDAANYKTRRLLGFPSSDSVLAGQCDIYLLSNGVPALTWPYTVEDGDTSKGVLLYAVAEHPDGIGSQGTNSDEWVSFVLSKGFIQYAGIGAVNGFPMVLTNKAVSVNAFGLTAFYSTNETGGVDSSTWHEVHIKQDEANSPINNPVFFNVSGSTYSLNYFVYCVKAPYRIVLARVTNDGHHVNDWQLRTIATLTSEECSQPCRFLRRTHDNRPMVYYQDGRNIKVTISRTADGSGAWSTQCLGYVATNNLG